MFAAKAQQTDPFLEACNGYLSSALKWDALDKLWQAILEREADWYIYHVGEIPPEKTVSHAELERFLNNTRQLLHEEHQEDYCGIVYADDHQRPNLVKIYDPGNLGVVCGFSDEPTYPGWILSILPPSDITLPDGKTAPWWRKLFSA